MDEVTKVSSLTRAPKKESAESRHAAAKQELLGILRKHPFIREALKIPGYDSDDALLQALSHAPNKFETLRNAGLTLSEAMRATDLLDMALEAPVEQKARRVVSKRSLLRVWLSTLLFLELLICGLMVYTLETSAGGWSVGTCSIAMFTNVTCREQTSNHCAVDLEVRGTLDGRLRFYTMQNWHLPVSYKTEMGGSSYAAYLGDRLRCCNDKNGHVGSCCSLMDPQTEIFCDNLQLLGRVDSTGAACPGHNWDCIYLVHEDDAARAKAVQTYTPPNIMNFIVPAGVVGALMVLTLVSSAIIACCEALGLKMPRRRPSLEGEEMDQDALEDMEKDGSRQPRSGASASSKSEGSDRGTASKGRKKSVKVGETPAPVVEEIGELSPGNSSPLLMHGGSFSSSYRDFSKMSPGQTSASSGLATEDQLPLNPALATVPEAVLSLPGVVQELEIVAGRSRGQAQRNAIEEECRKYIKWESHEKPLHQLDEKDIHPNFRYGSFAQMAQQAQALQNATLSPLIEPLPPSMHQPPSLPGSRPGSRPGTAGRPQSVQAWARPASAVSLRSAGRPGSAKRGGKAMRPSNEKMPQKPSSLPAKIEIANF